MGMHPKRLGDGFRWGLGAAVPIAAAIGLAAALPATRKIFVDDRVAAGRRKVLFETLVRIPIGTALAEEVLFRGALLGVLERRRSRRVADALTGALFGLSHVLPTVDRLNGTHSDAVGEKRHARTGAVIGVVVATMAAGYGLAWLRDKSGSLAAPVIAHAVLNDLAFLAALAASRSDEDSNRRSSVQIRQR
jgi:CAAX protease family protein